MMEIHLSGLKQIDMKVFKGFRVVKAFKVFKALKVFKEAQDPVAA